MVELLKRPDVTCVIAAPPPDDVGTDDLGATYGWGAATKDRELLWVYVRRIAGLRRQGIGTALMMALGCDPMLPTRCRFWSPYAARMAARGYRLYYEREHHA